MGNTKKLIQSVLKEDGKVSRKALRHAVVKKMEGDESKDEKKEKFGTELDALIESGKIRLGGDELLEYVRKSSREEDKSGEKDGDISAKSAKKSKNDESAPSSSAPSSSAPSAASAAADDGSAPAYTIDENGNKVYPPPPVLTGNNTILLFYAYCSPGPMSRNRQDEAIAQSYAFLKELGVTGRLRIGREGFNSTLTGPHDSIRKFVEFLKTFDPATFGPPFNQFKFVDNQHENQLLPTLKVFPVTEIVTYGFDSKEAPLGQGGTHLQPKEFHAALSNPNSVVIDVRNFNETLIGKFAPPVTGDQKLEDKVLDPCMRRSTEFPQWVEDNKNKLEGKQVLMYCTGGVRCERASAFMRHKGVENVFQLDGGIHRYLEEYEEDGGFWKGKNYTFDKRFSHGAKNAEIISECVLCKEPWERYNAHQKCTVCAMEVLVCRPCVRKKPNFKKKDLFCPLCDFNKPGVGK